MKKNKDKCKFGINTKVNLGPMFNSNTSNLKKIKDADIKQSILSKINSGEMFSAYDVTVELRNNGFEVFHKQVKKVIEKDVDFKFNGYTSHSDPTKTFLIYHDREDDVLQYNNKSKHPITIISTPSGIFPTSNIMSKLMAQKVSLWTTLYPQTKGRLNLSKSVLNSIGYNFKDGDVIIINAHNKNNTPSSIVEAYRARSKGVRISIGTFKDYIGIKKQYVIKNENGNLTIY
jgi:hypothetical protein